MKKGGAAHARKKKSAKGNKDHKDNSASDPIDYWLTAEERKKVASGEPILPVDKTMEVVLSVVQPPPVDYSALPPGLKPTALHASDEKTQLPESPKPGNVQKASGESANKSDGAAADHQRRLSSKETKRSTQGPLRSREKVSSKVPVIEGAYGVADRPLTPPSAPQAYGVADRPMGFRSAERTSTHKRPVMEGAYGVADRPKSSAPAVQAYGVVDRPVAQPSAKV
ncbi:unnamed protein product [Heligmosomoides polygyrus]|uniref:LARP1 n=1 Tax=Heligmosomoides polygyrus TaxID=6339 RepID=A0A183FUF7_HELPZ|nr:unnamed protein product [Heligmosomoides polygyrus]